MTTKKSKAKSRARPTPKVRNQALIRPAENGGFIIKVGLNVVDTSYYNNNVEHVATSLPDLFQTLEKILN